jgi:repressor LexA
MVRDPQPTARQKEILACIRDFMGRHQRPPTFREIGTLCGISSTNGVNEHLRALETKGLIRREGGHSRAIELLGDQPDPHTVPLLGRVAAGAPILADENIEARLPLLPGLSPSEGLFGLRVSGDSMVDDGVFDGDLVYVQKDEELPPPGTMTVVMLDGEVTVKHVRRKDGGYSLIPANKAHRPLEVRPGDGRDFRIVGRVVAVLRVLARNPH